MKNFFKGFINMYQIQFSLETTSNLPVSFNNKININTYFISVVIINYYQFYIFLHKLDIYQYD